MADDLHGVDRQHCIHLALSLGIHMPYMPVPALHLAEALMVLFLVCTAVGKHTIGYAGPFSISDAIPATTTSGQIFHGPLTVANVPAWVGTRQIRNYTLWENGAYLNILSQRDGGYRGSLWWKRLD